MLGVVRGPLTVVTPLVLEHTLESVWASVAAHMGSVVAAPRL